MTRPSLYRGLRSEAIRRCVYPLLLKRWRPSAPSYLRELRSYEFASLATIENVQWSRIQAIVLHAGRNVPHYRRLFSESGIQTEAIRSREDFARLPILTKATVQAAGG